MALPPALPRGRWAPSPSGLLHVGNARTALVAWLSARGRGGSFVWRLEDLDPPREVPGAAAAGEEDLVWLGLDWDEGAGRGGPREPYRQSLRGEHYEAALESLARQGRLFPCRRSRKDLQDLATAPHGHHSGSEGSGGPPPYPPSLRPRRLAADWFERYREREEPDAALRFRVDTEPVRFTDRVQGPVEERVDLTVGDFVLKRRDGLYAYQLAVVVDDLAMGINEVVRGRDLIDSTARQIQLIRALGGTPPAYAHIPLVLNDRGEKLSKRDQGLTLVSLREAGVRPQALVGYLALSLGLQDTPRPCHPGDLLPHFAADENPWARLRREDWVLPENLTARLLAAD